MEISLPALLWRGSRMGLRPYEGGHPRLQVAGTGKSDSETVILLEKMDEMFDSLSDDIVKAIARRTDVEHGVMHSADGYVTAWFM